MQVGEKEYKTVQGFVYAGVWEKEANGKKLREFMISNALDNDQQVKVTVWPSHSTVPVKVGDYIVANGTYDKYKNQNKETGEFVINHSISVNKFINMGYGLGELTQGKPHNASIPKKRISSDEIPGL